MKKFYFLFTILAAAVVYTGCSTKFNVAAPYKNITIVWGYLDEADTAHYIRIQKAYLDQNLSAISMAKSSDSNYLTNVDVRMERIDYMGVYGVAGSIYDTFHINRVDLSTEGYPKDSGVFYNSPNYAYKFKNSLDPNLSYRLVITNPATGEIDSVETPVIADDITSFHVPIFDDSTTRLAGLDFASTNQYVYADFIANYNAPANFDWKSLTTPVGIAQLIIQFYWADSNIINNSKIPRSYTYNLGYTTLSSSGGLDYKVHNTQLYSAIIDALGFAPANTVRLMDVCKLYIYLSTPDYSTYQNVTLTQGSGLTGNEIEPTYTNVQGKNVLGLFTARGLRSGYVTIDRETIDSLRASNLLVNSKIVGTVYH